MGDGAQVHGMLLCPAPLLPPCHVLPHSPALPDRGWRTSVIGALPGLAQQQGSRGGPMGSLLASQSGSPVLVFSFGLRSLFEGRTSLALYRRSVGPSGPPNPERRWP